jgi:hypothetical protein
MTWLEPTAIKTAYELFQSVAKSPKLTARLKRLKKRILSGELQVLVSGAGGVGKTTFARLLTSDNPLFAEEVYRPDLTTKKIVLPGEFPAQLLVVPGQERYLTTDWSAAASVVKGSRSAGVVNIVAYGFHSVSTESLFQLVRHEAGASRNELLERFLEERRNAETQRLQFLLSQLEGIGRPLWMVTLVTKQDLWWPDSEKVHAHYSDGEYGKAINGFERLMKQRKLGFSHHFVSVSQTHQNYETKVEGDLVLTAAGYTLKRHLESLSNAIERFWEISENGRPSLDTMSEVNDGT